MKVIAVIVVIMMVLGADIWTALCVPFVLFLMLTGYGRGNGG